MERRLISTLAAQFADLEVAILRSACYACNISYSGVGFNEGLCGDLSSGQREPCPRRLIVTEWAPVYRAFHKGTRALLFCPTCNKWHEHGQEDGMRVHHGGRKPNSYYVRSSFFINKAASRDAVKAWNIAASELFSHVAHRARDHQCYNSIVGIREFLGATPQLPVVATHTRGMSMRLKTEFFKDGDHLAIRTNATTEDEFIGSAAQGLAEMIDSGRFANDWEFQLLRWLRNIVDVTCKLRGYKADVHEERVITSGDLTLREENRVNIITEPAERAEAVALQ